MCDNETGSSLHQIIHRFLNLHFCSCIDGGCCFVKDQDLVVRKDRPRDRKKLFLSLGNVAGLFIQYHLVSARLLHDEVVDMCCFCCCDHFFIRCIQSAITDVFHDRSGEQPGILEHHTEHLVKFASVEVSDIVSVYLDCTLIHIIETHQEFDHGGLTCSGRTYDCDLLSVMYICGEVMNDDLIRVVTELYMLELYISIQTFDRIRMFRLLYFFLFLEEFKYSLGCRCG